MGDQGTAPKKVIFLEGEKSKVFSKTPTQFMSLIPTVYNADTLGIRPDLIKRPINSWAELLNPEFKGKAAILNIPSIGIMDAAMVVEAKGIYKYPDKGNMTKAEIDLTIKTLIEAKKAGQFRSLWKDFNESGQPDGVRRGGDPVDVVAGRDGGAHQGHRLHLPAAEGRLPRLGRGLRRAGHANGKKLDATYEFINWFLDGWAGAYLNRQGYYSRGAGNRQGQDGTLSSGPTGWKASRPRRTSSRPTATCWPRSAQTRDGGSYERPHGGGGACWNALMDENTYMVQKWNEFVAA